MSEEKEAKKVRAYPKEKLNQEKHKAVKPKLYKRRNGLVLSLTGGKVQIRDLSDHSTFETEIPKELEGKGIVEPGRKIFFLHYEGKYKIET